METVRLLDSYRMAVAHDHTAIRLLSFLQRDGAQTDTELSGKTSLTLTEARAKLTQLFRANLVQLWTGDLYAPTEMAEQLLTSVGVADAVGADAVETSGLAEQHKRFLVTFFALRQRPPAWRRYISAAAKTAKQLELYARLGDEVRTRLWYGMLAGLDPVGQELGADFACRHAFERADFALGRYAVDIKHFSQRCMVAAADRARSNEFIATGKQAESKVDGEVTLALTLTRLFASLQSHHADPGLAAAAELGGVNNKARHALRAWMTSFEPAYATTMRKHLWYLKPDSSSLIDALFSELSLVSADWPLGIDSASSDHIAARPSRIVTSLRLVEEQLAHEELSSGDKAEASAIVGRLQKSLSSAALGNDTAGAKSG
jgi:hypothetical protein